MTMKKFEYYSFFAVNPAEVDNTLDELGNCGWEEYSIVHVSDGIWAYLKRKKRQ